MVEAGARLLLDDLSCRAPECRLLAMASDTPGLNRTTMCLAALASVPEISVPSTSSGFGPSSARPLSGAGEQRGHERKRQRQ